MNKTKIELPEKEKLIETFSQVQGKTKTMRHAAKIYFVSVGTVSKWIKELGIQFDEAGMVIIDSLATAKIEDPVIKELDDSLKNMGPLLKEITLEVKSETLIPDYESITDTREVEQPEAQEPNVRSEIIELLKGKEPKINIQKVTDYINELDTKELSYKLGYAEYDIEDVLVQVDFRKKLVSINGSKDMTFEECNGVLELLNQII